MRRRAEASRYFRMGRRADLRGIARWNPWSAFVTLKLNMGRGPARIVFSFLFVGFWGLLGLMACTRTAGPAVRVLQVQLSAEPVSLDPALAEDGAAFRILANVMEGLVGYDGAGEL